VRPCRGLDRTPRLSLSSYRTRRARTCTGWAPPCP